jgi:Secreted repeat of unknown function
MGHFDLAGSSRNTQSAAVSLHKLSAKAHGQPEHRDEHRLLNMVGLGPEEEVQCAYKGKPVYFWAKDQKPGDRTGDGFNRVWRLARP